MSWTYSGDPSDSTLDEVRFLIGDTNSTDQQLSNEEILYLITTYTTALMAAYHAALQLSARYTSKWESKSVDGLSISFGDRAKKYARLAQDLLDRAALIDAATAPYAGGISIDDRDSVEEDTDRVAPAFTRTTMEV